MTHPIVKAAFLPVARFINHELDRAIAMLSPRNTGSNLLSTPIETLAPQEKVEEVGRIDGDRVILEDLGMWVNDEENDFPFEEIFKELSAYSYRELQEYAKSIGIKANQSKAKLLELLYDYESTKH